MGISYNNLWKMLIDKGMTKTDLRHATGISSVTLARLSKREPVVTSTLEKICKVLGCGMGDVVEYIPDDERKDNE